MTFAAVILQLYAARRQVEHGGAQDAQAVVSTSPFPRVGVLIDKNIPVAIVRNRSDKKRGCPWATRADAKALQGFAVVFLRFL